MSTEPFFLTPGPSEFVSMASYHLSTSFGRGDERYDALAGKVERFLLELSGQNHLVSIQGSGSLANQVIAENFLYGRVLVLDTGYYSLRLKEMASASKNVDDVTYSVESSIPGTKYDWLFATPVETGLGLLTPIVKLRSLADKLGARLALDAVASIGLEDGHELADVIGFSSCKGLFGLTGACFVASKSIPEASTDSFYLAYDCHKSKAVTGPNNQMQSLFGLIGHHPEIRGQVLENKQLVLHNFRERLTYPSEIQPVISTSIVGDISFPGEFVRYQPRSMSTGTEIISSLGYLSFWKKKPNPYLELRPKEGP